MTTPPQEPRSIRISVVLEEYNEEHAALAMHNEAIDNLLQQDFALNQVELVLTGSEGHLDESEHPREWDRFGHIARVPLEPAESHYWAQKNAGARVARGEIVAWLDSDVVPERTWLSAIAGTIAAGADVSVGPSLFRHPRLGSHSPLMLAAASVSWGFVLGRGAESSPEALLGHNVAMRRELALANPFPTEESSYGSTTLFYNLRDAGARIAYNPKQRTAHAMTFRWWTGTRHYRSGFETYRARLDPRFPRLPWPRRARWLEPPVLRAAVSARDLPRWLRFRRVVGTGAPGAVAILPLVLVMSIVARSAEVAGMYAALVGRKPRSARF